MKFLKFISSLFIIYETSISFVNGQTDEQKTDCTKLLNYIYENSEDYSNNCCSSDGVMCDSDGNVTKFRNLNIKIPDLTGFPYLPKIEEMYINQDDLKEIPENILKLSTLKILDVQSNYIEKIPPEIQNLSQLEELDVNFNEIKELPIELFNLKNLKRLGLGANHIEVIPSAIQNLSNLEKFNVNTNDIKELPNELFSLKNLDYLDIGNNQHLNPKLTKFGKSPVKLCVLNSLDIACYEPNTCEMLTYNNKDIADSEAGKYFKACSIADINEHNSDSNQNNEKLNSLLIIGGFILGGVIIIILGVLVTFILIKKSKSKRNNQSDFDSRDEFRNNSIKIVLNEKKNDNTTTPISNNNNNTQNNLLNNNLSPNIVVNSSSYNSSTLPVGIVLINNPPNPGNYVMSGIPLYNNNNQELNRESIDMQQKIQQTLEKSKMSLIAKKSEEVLYSTSYDDKMDPPPEYSKNE